MTSDEGGLGSGLAAQLDVENHGLATRLTNAFKGLNAPHVAADDAVDLVAGDTAGD
jgi:hypothetical protein